MALAVVLALNAALALALDLALAVALFNSVYRLQKDKNTHGDPRW